MKKSAFALTLAILGAVVLFLTFQDHSTIQSASPETPSEQGPSAEKVDSTPASPSDAGLDEEPNRTLPVAEWRNPRDWSHASVLSEVNYESENTTLFSFNRLRIVETDGFDFPILLDETVTIDPNNGNESSRINSSMAANQVLIHSDNPLDPNEVNDLAGSLGWAVKASLKSPYIAVLQTDEYDFDTVDSALAAIALSAGEIQASANAIFYASATPNDLSFTKGEQWGLDQPEDNDIDAVEGWNTRSTAADVVIAITDSGIRLDHEDLVANLWKNVAEIPENRFDDDGNGYIDDYHGINTLNPEASPDDDNGHGTHVAGIAGATGNNQKGIAGVAWQVQLMAIKCLNEDGQGSLDAIIEAIDYAVRQEVDIINASWGAYLQSPALSEAVARTSRAGILFVAASGNNGTSHPTAPASYPFDNVVAVGATNESGDRAHFSNYNWSQVDVLAPGSNILSTWNDSPYSYATLNGTSMAAPLVSGILALNLAQHPDNDIIEQVERLRASADKRANLKYYSISGGIANLEASLEMTRIPRVPTITQTSELEVTILEGEAASFSVTAESDIEISYQWYFDEQKLEGETSSRIEFNTTAAERRGSYTVEVSNADGSVSGRFELNVFPRMEEFEAALQSNVPVYVSHESHWEIIENNSIPSSPYLAATERAPGTVGQIIFIAPGAGLFALDSKATDVTQFGLTALISTEFDKLVPSEQHWDTAQLLVRWSGPNRLTASYGSRHPQIVAPAGGIALDNVRFYQESVAPPFITHHPRSATVTRFSNQRLSCNVEGEGINFQWHKDGSPIDGATESSLNLEAIDDPDQGDYYVVASNSFGSTQSKTASIKLNNSPVAAQILNNSQLNQSLVVGDSIVLSRQVVGDPPINYQWLKNEHPLPRQTNATLTLESVNETHTGLYKLKVSNHVGHQTSNGTHLTVVDASRRFPPRFVEPQENVSLFAEEGKGFLSLRLGEIRGTPNFEYTWYKDGELPESRLVGNSL